MASRTESQRTEETRTASERTYTKSNSTEMKHKGMVGGPSAKRCRFRTEATNRKQRGQHQKTITRPRTSPKVKHWGMDGGPDAVAAQARSGTPKAFSKLYEFTVISRVACSKDCDVACSAKAHERCNKLQHYFHVWMNRVSWEHALISEDSCSLPKRRFHRFVIEVSTRLADDGVRIEVEQHQTSFVEIVEVERETV